MTTPPIPERPRIVIDANLFFVPPVRDVLLTAGWLEGTRLIEVVWSEALLAEVARNWSRVTGPERAEERWGHFEGRFRSEFATGLVESLAPLPPGGRIAPEDRHVVALALAARAQGIVTLNLRDFPTRELAALGLQVWHPDALCRELHVLDPTAMLAVLNYQGAALRRPRSLAATLDALAKVCPRFVEQVRADAASR